MKRQCIVTGASGGIGKVITKHLLDEGYDVIGMARSKPKDWYGDFIEADFTDINSVKAAGEQIIEMEPIYALINNAGFAKSDNLEKGLEVDSLLQTFMVNTIAPAILTSIFSKIVSVDGRIINICSNTMYGKSFRTAYGGSKAALAAFTRTWALELASKGIRVNAISPGAVDTEMIRRKILPESIEEKELIDSIPLKRITKPDDVAAVVIFLLGKSADSITGQIIHTDGGSSVGKFS